MEPLNTALQDNTFEYDHTAITGAGRLSIDALNAPFHDEISKSAKQILGLLQAGTTPKGGK
jgi:hypothetical protein